MRSIGRFKSYWIGGELVDECGALDLQALAGEAKDKLTGSAPEISETSGFPDFSNGEAKRKWFKLDEIVVVFADLKNSTALGVNKHDKSTSRIYEASTGVGVRLLQNFHPKFVEVQGDGFFGVFHGDSAAVKAMTAAMMLAHFSKYILEPQIKKSRDATSCPDTGLKLGVATGRTLVKQIGVPGFERPIWAGKPVNYAAKCAESGQAHQVVVTKNVYEYTVRRNNFLMQPCYHDGHPKEGMLWNQLDSGSMWKMVEVDGIPEKCLARDAPWCDGKEDNDYLPTSFARKLLAGEHIRATKWFQRNRKWF